MNIRKYNIKFLIISCVLLLGITTQVFSDQIADSVLAKTEITVVKKKKSKRAKSVQQSLSLLKGHLHDAFQEANREDTEQRLFTFVHSPATGSFVHNTLLMIIISWLGVPYKYGGKSIHGTDCSGFTSSVVNETYGRYILSRSSQSQSKDVRKIFCRDSLRFGDLLFFAKTKLSKRVNHVAIYLGSNLFAHSSTGKGVIISELSGIYNNRFRFGGRIPIPENYSSL